MTGLATLLEGAGFVFFLECDIYYKNFKYYGENAVKLDFLSLDRCLKWSTIDGIKEGRFNSYMPQMYSLFTKQAMLG